MNITILYQVVHLLTGKTTFIRISDGFVPNLEDKKWSWSGYSKESKNFVETGLTLKLDTEKWAIVE